jgi:hypothetical protein
VAQKATIREFEQQPHFFQVFLTLPDPDPEQYQNQARIAKNIIDQEKPAHTYYALTILLPTMQLNRFQRRYDLPVTQPGQITATLTLETSPPPEAIILTLTDDQQAVKATGDQDPDRVSTFIVTYDVSDREVPPPDRPWTVTVKKISRDRLTGHLTLTLPGKDTPISHTITLGTGLQLGRPPTGNTVLGNQEGLS